MPHTAVPHHSEVKVVTSVTIYELRFLVDSVLKLHYFIAIFKSDFKCSLFGLSVARLLKKY